MPWHGKQVKKIARHVITLSSTGNNVPGMILYLRVEKGVKTQILRAVRLPLRTARWMLCGSAQSPME